MNSAQPADMRFSFTGFAERGGATDHHADGFGVGFFEDNACRLFIDNQPAAISPVAALIKQYPIKSRNILAHIRKATQGQASVLKNCHPFLRELCGRHWMFAHNGDLKDYHPVPSRRYRPIGDTDSERAFCQIMEALINIEDAPTPCESATLFTALAEAVELIAQHGVFNFLLSDGRSMFVHCSTHLHLLLRTWPFEEAQLIDADMHMDFSTTNTPHDQIAVVATQPLTHEKNWQKLQAGQLLWLQHGKVVQQKQLHVSQAARTAYANSTACL